MGTVGVSDYFGRTTGATVMTKDPTNTDNTSFASIATGYQYKSYGTDKTTGLVTTLTNTISGSSGNRNVNYTYDYDANGRISSANGVSYTYDEAGQLKTVTKQGGSESYTYDSNGNITSRTVTTSDEALGTQTTTDSFGYGADSWEDRLTSFNNQSITYDAIGNPTSYLGATLVWRGRELQSYQKGNKQIAYNYDVDGMRYKKTVKVNNAVTEVYDYVYSDGQLLAITHTASGVSNSARFIYDSTGEIRGFILNDTDTYMYLKNLQGDITALVDESGEIILAYSYDSWGKVTFSATSMANMAIASTLSVVNPFTYRGYCYDYDIELYYLQSRYYDPNICRFINADSTDYLGATDTVLSYNLFAYCENDTVNRVDPNGCYSASKAIAYAKEWWNNRNIYYWSYGINGGDCTNFVSQCLYAGGYKKDSTWFSYFSSRKQTGAGWYSQKRIVSYTYNPYYGWYVPIYKTYWYKVSGAWSSATKLYNYLRNNLHLSQLVFDVGEREKFQNYIKKGKIKVGDVAFFDDCNDEKIHHSVIIGKVVNNSSDVDAYYYSHTSSRNAETCAKSKKNGIYAALNNERVYIIRMK